MSELFVMVLGASNYTYAEATLTQGLKDFVGSTIRGFEHFGGVPEVIVPDQLRSAVKGPDRYEPDVVVVGAPHILVLDHGAACE